MRLSLPVFVGGGTAMVGLVDGMDAQESRPAPDMRRLLAVEVTRHFASSPVSASKSSATTAASMPKPAGGHDAEVLTLPPFLVRAPVLRIPSKEDTMRPVVGFVRPVDYGDYAGRDERQQREMNDLLSLADLARRSGDAAVADQIKRETYRALVRNPTPLERAMDRSVNGGRF